MVSVMADAAGGSMVDDGQRYEFIIQRNGANVLIVMDRLESIFKTSGIFFTLDLDKVVRYLGSEIYLHLRNNFINCFSNIPWFLCACSTSLMKTLGGKENLPIMSNSFFSHCFLPFRGSFCHVHQIQSSCNPLLDSEGL